MARRRSIVTGGYSPVKDKRTGQQVVDPERGRKWRITAELPRSGGKRKRKYRDVYALLYSLRGAGDAIKNQPETIETLKRLGFTDKEIRSPKALHKFKVVKLYPIVYLAAVTGMRLSELLALKWDNLNLQKGKIKVYESSHYGTKEDDKGNSHHINPTKENKPKSDIDLSQSDLEFLKSYRQEQLARRARYRGKYTDHGLVFTNNNGSHLRNDTVSKEFTYFARSINVSITFHGLRHTHCTLLLASGVPDIYVARRVGHQKPSTTTDTYGHAEKGAGANLGNVFKAILAEDHQCEFDHNVEGPTECNVESGEMG